MLFPDIKDVIKSLAGQTNPLVPNQKETIGFRWFGLRKADVSKKCSCQGIQGTADPVPCTRCLSTGYLFTDFLVRGYGWMGVYGVAYPAGPGLLSTQQRNLIVEYDNTITKFDYILELDLNPETGEVRQPFKILRYFRAADSIAIVGVASKIKYWRVLLEEANINDGRPGPIGPTFNYGGNRSNDQPQ